jgi:hypothetical protein
MRALALASLCLAAALAGAAEWPVGARVIVDKAGAGHRAIVLRSEASRSFVAYEGVDEVHDEWVEAERIRGVRPPAPAAAEPKPETPSPEAAAQSAALPVPEPLPHALELPRVARGASVAEIWLEQLARKDPADPVRFSTGALAVPQFRFGDVAGIGTNQAPLRTALLQSQGRIRGFAAIEGGVALYQRDAQAGFVRVAQLDLASLQGFAPEGLVATDFNHDQETDLVVTAGPMVQVFFGTAAGEFTPSAQAFRAPLPVRGAAPGRFFTGPLSAGVAVIEGFNSFAVLRVAQSGVTEVEPPYELRFDRLTRLATGDFDGDGFTDVAVTAESRGRSTGAWMFFNQRGANKSFLWPVGGRDDFARDIAVADLDRDGRDDLILTDSDVEQGERVRVVFGSPGRAGWEDPWELISSEYGIGLGTASVTVADFNRDGRPDIGVGGRNGLRVYLGADYRRFSRNPVWPRLAAGNDFPEQRVFLAGDFDGDGAADLLGYTPAFATGYNLVYNATPASVDGLHVPAPLQRRVPVQSSTTVTKVEQMAEQQPTGAPRVRFLASRAEPYGQWRYRIVVEVAVLAENVVESVEATCKYEGSDTPVQVVPATARRTSDQQWAVEVILPRGRTYEFQIAARDDQGRAADPIRVTVNP